MDARMKIKPYPYQVDGILKIREKNFGLFWEMGLGKTFTVLFSMGTKPGISIVFAPISASQTWVDEQKKWRPDLALVSTIGLPKKLRAKQRARVYYHSDEKHIILLCNYEQAQEVNEWCIKYGINLKFAIADESSYIKSRKAKRTKAVLKIAQRATRRVILSGTPVLQGPLDLYTQIKFLNKEIFPENYYAFQHKYAVMGGFENKQIVKYKNLEHLTARIKNRVQSRKKEEVAPDLPEKIYVTRVVRLSEKERKNYDMIKKAALMELPSGKFVPIANALAKITKLTQAAGGFFYNEVHTMDESKPKKEAIEIGSSKRNEVVELLTTGELKGIPTIVWSVMRHELKSLSEELVKAGLNVASEQEDGSYRAAGNAFIRGDADVLVANPMALGYGMNLQRATAMIFVSNSYRYGDRAQAEARAHRIGQLFPVTIIDLIAENTIDSKILKIVNKKGSMAGMIMDELGVNIHEKEIVEMEF
jgi:SNF2 family DNA or RNA helicase